MTVFFGPSKRTRTPFALGWRPSPASITPAPTSSSLKRVIASTSASSGSWPASDLGSPFTNTITRISISFDLRSLAGSLQPRRTAVAWIDTTGEDFFGHLGVRARRAPPGARAAADDLDLTRGTPG